LFERILKSQFVEPCVNNSEERWETSNIKLAFGKLSLINEERDPWEFVFFYQLHSLDGVEFEEVAVVGYSEDVGGREEVDDGGVGCIFESVLAPFLVEIPYLDSL